MMKLVVLSALLVVAAAKPGLLHGGLTKTVHVESQPIVTKHITPTVKVINEHSHVEVREESLAKVGSVVESIPAGVSGYSSSVIHGKADIVTPIIAEGVNTRLEPIVKTYEAKVVEHAPIIKTIEHAPIVKTIEHAPIIKTIEHAPIVKTIEHAPIVKTIEHAPIVKTIAHAPIIKTIDPAFSRLDLGAGLRTLDSSVLGAAPLLRSSLLGEQRSALLGDHLSYGNSLGYSSLGSPLLRSSIESSPLLGERLDYGSGLQFASPLLRSPLINEASLSTFDSRPFLAGARLDLASPHLRYGAPEHLVRQW